MSSSKEVKVGVTGVGALGRYHVKTYSRLSDVHLVGVYDIDRDRAQEIADEFSTKPFRSVDELAAAVDCMSVAVPTDLHYAEVTKLLGLGKHVLVEKPLAATVAQGRKLVQLANEQKLTLQVGHVERFNPVVTFLETRIKHPRFIEAHRLAPYPPPRPGQLPRGTEVGVVLDLMIHDIDVILSLVKSDIAHIDAVGIPILSNSEDIANARINFVNGCTANLTASRVSQERMRKIRVFQSDAYLSLDYQNKCGEIVTRNNMEMLREPVPIADHDALQMELEDFIRCTIQAITTGQSSTPKVAAEHGLKALELADEISRQILEKLRL